MKKNTKLNKFMAGSVTAALVASAVAPAVSAAENNFQDIVALDAEAQASINALAEAGVVKGYDNGTKFDPWQNVKRGQVALMLTRVAELGLDSEEDTDTNFTDVTGDIELTGAVEALVNNNIASGYQDGTFKPYAQISRQHMAKLIVKAFDLELNEDVEVNITDLDEATTEMAEYIKILASHGITTQTEFNPQAPVSRYAFTLFLTRAMEVVFEEVEPAVKSVNAINAKEVVVTFNTALAEDTTESQLLAAFTLTDKTDSKAVLSEDRKTVTYTLDSTEVSNAKVTVAALDTATKDSNGELVKTAEYNALLTFEDTTAPAVASVEAKGTTSVITFTEPVQSEGTVSLNGAELTETTDYDLSADGKTLTVKNLEAEKSYRVDIVGATDFSGNIANPLAVNFTVANPVVDNSKPTVTSSVNGTEITLDFSEELLAQELNDDTTATEYAKVTVGSTVYYLTAAQQDTEDNTKFTLNAATALGSENFINTSVSVEGFKDAANNAGDAFEFTATLQKDTTAPKYVSVSSKQLAANDTGSSDVDAVYLTFDEEVTVTGNFTLKSKNGIVYTSATPIALNGAVSGEDVDGNGTVEGSEKYTVKVDVDLDENATYTFELAANTVADADDNTLSDTVTVSFTSGTFTPAAGTVTDSLVLAATNPFVVVDNNVFTVEYAVDVTSSALTASNYTLGGKALPAGTQLQFVDGTKKVRFTLPEASVTANGNYIFEAKNVVDTDGNTLKDGKATATINLKENIAPTASKVTVVDSKTFTVDFSEAIANQASASGLTVKVNDVAVTVTSAVAANGKLTVKTTNDFALTDNISVEFKDSNLVDANNNNVKNGVISK